MIHRRRTLYFTLGIAFGILASVFLIFFLRPSRESPPIEEQVSQERFDQAYDENLREVVLFFQQEESGKLFPERRRIYQTPSPESQAEQIIDSLVEGSQRGLGPVLPPQTRLRGFYLSPSGTAYVDFSEDIRTTGRLGTSGELSAVYSVVNSLTFNLPEVKRIRFLIEGAEVKTLAGHISVEGPLTENFDLVDREAPLR